MYQGLKLVAGEGEGRFALSRMENVKRSMMRWLKEALAGRWRLLHKKLNEID